uniref:beta-N-acetylhexosaminidase n=1 Tax=uncultured Elusimicrobia bacterium TaxID=699876 RepID=A0A650EMK2_9BACT|nr:beta-N-acetylhexosaminidase [uncultured Elusimicrobia bacterium]
MLGGYQHPPAKDVMPVILLVSHYPIPQEDKDFFKRINPYGFLLSIPKHANMKPGQLRAELEEILERKDFLFFLDQEGGSVNRLRQFKSDFWSPPAGNYGEIAKNDENLALSYARQEGLRTGQELKKLTIDVVFGPVADLIDTEQVFRRNRYYSTDHNMSKKLADAFAQGLAEGGVIPCYKHFPGFASERDPHHVRLEVKAGREEIIKRALFSFEKANQYGCLMTGHTLYWVIDDKHISTYSPALHHLIRKTLGFKGLIIPDALNMVAADGPDPRRAGSRMNRALSAGADVVMPFFPFHFNPQEKEEQIRQIDPKYIKRFQRRRHLLKRKN